MSKNILIATRQELLPLAQRVYPEPEFTFSFFSTLDEAVNALNEEFDLITCGVHFGDGQLYDFLRIAKSHGNTRNVPFVIVDTGNTALSPFIQQSVEIAARALGAAAVLPLTKWREELGDEAALEKYRNNIRKLFPD